MINPQRDSDDKESLKHHSDSKSIMDLSYKNLRVDCKKCFGLCCTALYFSASEGFPIDKAAGIPCINLQTDFLCTVHDNLSKQGLKGCTAYDCFGAGQKVAQVTYGGHDWRQVPESAKQMFEIFLIMRQLHEILWYLKEAQRLNPARHLQTELNSMIAETEELTHLKAESLTKLYLDAHRNRVNPLLSEISEILRTKARSANNNSLKRRKLIAGRLDLIGVDLKNTNLRGADLRGALLIAADLREADLNWADLIGADLRDADLRGADLTNSIYVTQAQINSAKGNNRTKLPTSIIRPIFWSN